VKKGESKYHGELMKHEVYNPLLKRAVMQSNVRKDCVEYVGDIKGLRVRKIHGRKENTKR